MAKQAVVKIVGDTKAYDRTIDQAAKKLNDFGKNGVGSLTSLMGAWGKLVPAIGAAVGGMTTFNKVIGSTQTLTDEFGRAQESCKIAVDSFFYSIANGRFEGFIEGLKDVARYSRDAYNALDDLGTFKIFSGAEFSELDAQRTELAAIIKSGKRVEDGKLVEASKSEIEKAKSDLNMLDEQRLEMVRTTMEKESNAYQSMMREILAKNQHGGSLEDIDASISAYIKSYRTYDKAAARKKELDDLIAKNQILGTSSISAGNSGAQMSVVTKKNNAFADQIESSEEYKRLTAILEISDEDLQKAMEHRIAAAASSREMNQLLRADSKVTKDTSSPSGGLKLKDPKYDKGSIGDLQKYLTEVNETVMSATETEVREAALRLSKMISQEIDRLKGNAGYAITGSVSPVKTSEVKKDTQGITGLKDAAAKMDTSGVDTAVKKYQDLMEIQKEWAALNNGAMTQGVQSLTGAFSTLVNAIGGTEGAMISMIGQMAQEVVQGVMNIASLNAQKDALRDKATAALGSAAAGAMEAHSWIPFAGVAIGAGMVATIISTLMSLPKFAQGGVVGGSSYNGDKVLARLNSGEMVLTQQNQKNLLRILNGGGMSQEAGQGGVIKVRIENNQLVGTLSNASRRARYRV